MRQLEVVDERDGRNRCRIVYHVTSTESSVYIESWGNHDGVSVFTRVQVSANKFRELVRTLGVM